MLVATRSADGQATKGVIQPDTTSMIKAGGVDLLDQMQEDLVTPSRIINIRALPNMDELTKL